MSFGKIIVGYDEGDSSRAALKLALLLQRIDGAALVVANEPGSAEAFAEAQAQLPYGAPAEFRAIEAHSVVDGLRDMAEREHADLVVVGAAAHRSRGLHAGGSIGERLLHSSPCAVAVAPREFASDPDPGLRVVGVAFDDSEQSRRAVACAREIALAAGATIRLIGIAEPIAAPTVGIAAMSGWPTTESEWRERLRHELEVQADQLPAELRAQVILADGQPADEIIKRAGVLSLLVMGSRGYGPLRRALLGSVSAPVIRAAACPVLVVPRAVDSSTATAAAGTAV